MSSKLILMPKPWPKQLFRYSFFRNTCSQYPTC